MSIAGQHTLKSPSIRRIHREAAELSATSSSTLHAAPLDDDIFEWHFTLAGPRDTPYADGLYHGRITLPTSYPLRPPSFRFLTPSARFEVNREICLSISGHHEESWQPAWGIRTALVALRVFMAGDAKGQLGGIDADERVRRRLAGESRRWMCATCRKTNERIMEEREEEEGSSEARKENDEEQDEVPVELRLGFKDEMVAKQTQQEARNTQSPTGTREDQNLSSLQLQQTNRDAGHGATNPGPQSQSQIASQTAGAQPPTAHVTPTGPGRGILHPQSIGLQWIDIAIAAVTAILGAMIMRKLLSVL